MNEIEALRKRLAEMAGENAIMRVELDMKTVLPAPVAEPLDRAVAFDIFVASGVPLARFWGDQFVARIQRKATETQASQGAWNRIEQRMVDLEAMLGISRETEIPAADAVGVRYHLPDGSKTNSCEKARHIWRSHCFQIQTELREWVAEKMVEPFPDEIVDRLAPEIAEVPQSQVVNSTNTGQSPGEIIADMLPRGHEQ
jgi:hypothetical protein